MAQYWVTNFGQYNLMISSGNNPVTPINGYGNYSNSRFTWGDNPLHGQFEGGHYEWSPTEKLKITLDIDTNERRMYYKIYLENVLILSNDFAWSVNMTLDIGFGVDDETEEAYPYDFWRESGNVYLPGWTTTLALRKELYPYIIEAINPTVYQWSSVPAISGKNGILTLSTADDSYHTGDTVSNIPISDVSLSAPSRLSTLAAGIPNGETVSVVYAGSIDHMDITPQLVQYTVSLILAGQAVYTITPNRYPRWLGFIIDEENEVAKLVWYTEHREADILTDIMKSLQMLQQNRCTIYGDGYTHILREKTLKTMSRKKGLTRIISPMLP